MRTEYLSPDGARQAPVLRKTATDAAARRRLVHEASMLGLAQQPGVVEVAGLVDGEEATELTLRVAGDRMHIPGSLEPGRAADLLHRLATTVADLHERGITHGRVGLEHLVLDAEGKPVLGGFGDAWAHTGTDPDRFARGRAADVAALGELLTVLLAPGSDIALVPEHRHHLSADERVWEQRDGERRALLTLADQAAAADPHRQPSAARFAQLLQDTIPIPDEAASPAAAIAPEPGDVGSTLSNSPSSAGRIGAASADPPSTPRLARPEPLRHLLPSLPPLRWPSLLPSRPAFARLRSLPLRAAGIALVALAGLGLLTTGVVGLGHGSRPRVDGAAATASPSTPACAPDGAPASGSRADPCAAPVAVSGRTVTLGERRFELGQPGDVVTLGSWRCDGSTMPALLRPATGEIFVFDSWASPGHDVTVQPTAVVHGARSLRATVEADGCEALSVVLADGTTQALPLAEVGS